MTEEQKGALTTWLQAAVGCAALFIPGLSDAMQLAILGLGAASLTVVQMFLPKEDPMKAFERARARLAVERGIVMPTIEAQVQIDADAGAARLPVEGWPPPQDTNPRPPTGGNAA